MSSCFPRTHASVCLFARGERRQALQQEVSVHSPKKSLKDTTLRRTDCGLQLNQTDGKERFSLIWWWLLHFTWSFSLVSCRFRPCLSSRFKVLFNIHRRKFPVPHSQRLHESWTTPRADYAYGHFSPFFILMECLSVRLLLTKGNSPNTLHFCFHFGYVRYWIIRTCSNFLISKAKTKWRPIRPTLSHIVETGSKSQKRQIENRRQIKKSAHNATSVTPFCLFVCFCFQNRSWIYEHSFCESFNLGIYFLQQRGHKLSN